MSDVENEGADPNATVESQEAGPCDRPKGGRPNAADPVDQHGESQRPADEQAEAADRPNAVDRGPAGRVPG